MPRRKLENWAGGEACSLLGLEEKLFVGLQRDLGLGRAAAQQCSGQSAKLLAPQATLLCQDQALGEASGAQLVMLVLCLRQDLPNVPGCSSISVKERGKYFRKHPWDFALIVVISRARH